MTIPAPTRPLCAALVGASALALLVSSAGAEPAPPYSVLLAQSRASAPRPMQAQAEISEAEGRARQATALPNPTLAYEVENFSGTGPFSGRAAAESTVSVEQLIELGGKRGARVSAARAQVEAARTGALRSNADFAFDLAQAYAAAEAADRREQLAEEALGIAEDDSRIAAALMRAGKEADVRGVQARAAVQAARAGLAEARALRAQAFASLSALAGSPVIFTSISSGLLVHANRAEAAPEIDPLKSPGYLAAEAGREAAARAVRVERLKAVPDVTVSVGARRFEADGASAVVAGVALPFPVFDRNRGNIAAARAGLTGAEAKLNAARLDAIAEAASARARLSAAQARVEAATEGEAAAGEAARLARVGYEAGKLQLLELLNARRALAEARAQTLDAQIERLAAEAAIARLRGEVPFGDQ